MRRVVVTGLGAVAPLAGHGAKKNWRGAVEGRRVARLLPQLVDAGLPSQVAATLTDEQRDGMESFVRENLGKRFNPSAQSVPFILCAMASASEALNDAGILVDGTFVMDPDRTGVAIGNGVSSPDEFANAASAFAGRRGYRALSPFFVPRVLPNLAAGNVSTTFNLRGPNIAPATACAAGAHAIGDAFRLIKHGDADVMVAGGTEAAVSPLTIGGFARARALATGFNHPNTYGEVLDESDRSAASASRPFDAQREGFVMSEGSAVLVLEEEEQARRRGATIYAEITGYGLSGDANHITAPAPDGDGALRCMKAALTEASRWGLGLGESAMNEGARSDTGNLEKTVRSVGHINCHATSTPLGDAVELRAITRLLCEGGEVGREGQSKGDDKGESCVLLTSTKGATGHLLGAAGALEALFTVLALNEGVVPPTANFYRMEDELKKELVSLAEGVYGIEGEAEGARILPFEIVGGEARKGLDLRAALSNSFGFGGTNVSLVFHKYTPQ